MEEEVKRISLAYASYKYAHQAESPCSAFRLTLSKILANSKRISIILAMLFSCDLMATSIRCAEPTNAQRDTLHAWKLYGSSDYEFNAVISYGGHEINKIVILLNVSAMGLEAVIPLDYKTGNSKISGEFSVQGKWNEAVIIAYYGDGICDPKLLLRDFISS
ncbi:hypothetical protein [Microbulbifer spongiae]|uniref:Uncharacterized protein n=1 Tax=Microbulbifer spongiae TaxID=2944933 RepID=A0ABY9E9I4_9GAMM|nr:hypothetical protein [Microbulbifer sp. MI-G]WKD48753.1 hypothetical protein M8T91_12635 [Microbulbifer sp. MI-G]